MLKIELVPDLEHCIETTAKNKYAELLRVLLANKATSREIEEELEILRIFLENADFPRLRSESEAYLIKGRAVRFTVYLEDNIPRYEMSVT